MVLFNAELWMSVIVVLLWEISMPLFNVIAAPEISAQSMLEMMAPGAVMEFTCVLGFTAVVVDGNDVTTCDIDSRTWNTTGFHCRGHYLFVLGDRRNISMYHI